MNNPQLFKNEMFEVSVKIEGDLIIFDAEQVAKSLGFIQEKNNKQYIRWERVNEYLPKNSPEVGRGDFIPEPLVYKLAFKASNEVAEQFQDWLAIEVIPSIRKNGHFGVPKPLTEREQRIESLKLLLETSQRQDEMNKKISTHEKKILELNTKVDEQITIDHGEQRRIQKAVATRIYSFTDDKNERNRLFKELYREIKDRFGVSSYKDVKRKDMQAAVNYIVNWVPRRVS
ncbi:MULTISPECIES: ORF6C domain-containing protein [Bacillus]|uniref:ORF6C domain-containing protein n=1 Tax=Bacillus TaxID=1386 RepID=UPI000D036E81|nr:MULTISPECIES: ORF6C domain-containing protein [Bacillus]MCK6164629.1 ORF6C domain-containing protein [Bacillus pumilus]MCK6185192.1 ORF6C domain-containing protein [Bacillus pumilus]PRS46996.1 phage antirepressor [Bacillus sp. LNXM10]PRS53479.1 phage antirepressor [Bacillus sp. MZGC1]